MSSFTQSRRSLIGVVDGHAALGDLPKISPFSKQYRCTDTTYLFDPIKILPTVPIILVSLCSADPLDSHRFFPVTHRPGRASSLRQLRRGYRTDVHGRLFLERSGNGMPPPRRLSAMLKRLQCTEVTLRYDIINDNPTSLIILVSDLLPGSDAPATKFTREIFKSFLPAKGNPLAPGQVLQRKKIIVTPPPPDRQGMEEREIFPFGEAFTASPVCCITWF